MAISGINYNQLTRDQMITASLRKLGVLAEGQTPSAQNLADATVAFNSVIAELRTVGNPLWARVEYTFTPVTNVYTIGNGYTLNTDYPVRLYHAYRTEVNVRIPMDIVAKEDFSHLPTNSAGSPLKLCYTPGINVGTIELWPTPLSTSTATVTLVYQRPYDYMINSTDTLDFPEEWYNAIIYRVAVLLAPEWGVALPDRQLLETQADKAMAIVLGGGQEDASIYFSPDRGY